LDHLLNSLGTQTEIEKRDYAIINLISFTGLRRIEVSRLDVKDIYQDKRQYYIKICGKGHTEKDTTLPLTNDVIKPIHDYWNTRFHMGPWDLNSPAFVTHCNRGVNRIMPSFITKMVKRSLREIGLNDSMYSCHSLRHTAAALAMKAGCVVAQVQQMLRHKNMSTSEQYLKSFRQGKLNDGAAISILNNYFKEYRKTNQKRLKNQSV
jgi:integrase